MDILKGKNAILKLRTQQMCFNFRLDTEDKRMSK